MARRKPRRVQLGGGPREHFTKEMRAANSARATASMAMRSAEAGNCAHAIKHLTAAFDYYGAANAHAAYAHPKPYGKLTAAYRKRMQKNTGRNVSHAVVEAEQVVIAKCVR